MSTRQDYRIDLTVLHGHEEVIDVAKVVREGGEPWWNKTLTQVNDSVVRLGVIEGEFHWHKHDEDDEFFYVVEGHLFIDLEGKSLELLPGQGTTIRVRIPAGACAGPEKNHVHEPARQLAAHAPQRSKEPFAF